MDYDKEKQKGQFSQTMPPFSREMPAFVELLKQHRPFVSNWDLSTECPSDALDCRQGLDIRFEFPDPEGLLDSALMDFRRFLREAGIGDSGIGLGIRQADGLEHEAYVLTVGEDITLEASDTEGIRRGIYHLFDLIASSPYLKKCQMRRSPWLRNRISRCFFGPIKRPPFNVDELMNDIDYYPEEYLLQLAREGTNGLWLTIEFREICGTSIRPALPGAKQRLEKLRRTVEKCRRYGLKIWVFCIEPACWKTDPAQPNPLPMGHEELSGKLFPAEEYVYDLNAFCPKSETARKFLYESTNTLFKSVPHLGGLITIAHGERLTSCLSSVDPYSDFAAPCKGCELGVPELAQRVLEPMRQGIKDANADAELIAWLYMPYINPCNGWIYQIPQKLSQDTILAYNFESGMTKMQNGHLSIGGDYWLSGIGPSDRFGRMANAAQGHCSMAAKLQVASSHELATVPYIPVPGIIYRKYKAMRELGVQHVIQCWYFGNYPGLMNKAAGKLAYEDFSQGEDAFLEDLAKPEWGKDYTHIVQAWKHFSDGYQDYPMHNSFQYYGPMHDGPVWPLYPIPVHKALTRSWKPDEFPAGDAIGECLGNFTLGEMTEQVYSLCRKWEKGMEAFRRANMRNHEYESSIAEALDIQFHSAYHILKFYALRTSLIRGGRHPQSTLGEMSNIIGREILASRRLAALCRQDARLGYHSEAEVYKYFPEKLEWRAQILEDTLAKEMKELSAALAAGRPLSDLMLPQEEEAYPGTDYTRGNLKWHYDVDCDNVNFHFDFLGAQGLKENVQLYFVDADCMRPPATPVSLSKSNYPQSPEGWSVDISFPIAKFNFAGKIRFALERVTHLPDGGFEYSNEKSGDCMHDVRLIYWYYMPEKTRLLNL